MIPRPTLLLTAAALAACSGSNGPGPLVVPAGGIPAIGSTVVGGSADGLAAELLLAGARRDGVIWHAQQRPVPTATVAESLDAIALDHVQSAVLGTGAGPTLLGSQLVRRLAAEPGAPPDSNNRNGNLDETLAAEAARIVSFAATVPPAMATVPMLPWRSRSAELLGALDPAANATWQTRDLGERVLDLGQLASFLELRITAARRLLRDRSRGRYGIDPAAGALGLLAVQQVLAAEDTLFQSVFTSGGPLGPLENAEQYDPRTTPKWLPRLVRVDLDPAVVGGPSGFRPIDGASDLGTLAGMLRVAVDLATLGRPAAPLAVPELFRKTPFSPPPSVPVPPSITWTNDIAPLMGFRCGQCHLQQTRGGFSIVDYETMLLGGNKTRQLNLQFIVPGNSQASLLHQILTGPPPPFVQMPQNGVLPATEIALIDAWIDEGALKDPPAPQPPPQPGDDLALVSFRNLVTLHLDPATGALHNRREADGPSGVATARATGQALRGLADFVRENPNAEFDGQTAADYLTIAASYAMSHLVDAEGRCHDAVDIVSGTATGVANLRAHSALTAGLLAAGETLTSAQILPVAQQSATFLLAAYGNGEGMFANEPGSTPGSYDAATLTEVLAALRLASHAGVANAEQARDRLVLRLRPALAFAEWDRDGEVLGDGIGDTDGDGLFEPAAAGGDFGRLPLIADRIVVDPAVGTIPREPTWSADVRPLLEQKCGECHMNGSELGDYRLDTVRSLATPGESAGQFAMLVPGDPEASFFFRKISQRQPALGVQMPRQRTPLNSGALAVIRRWIYLGASNR